MKKAGLKPSTILIPETRRRILSRQHYGRHSATGLHARYRNFCIEVSVDEANSPSHLIGRYLSGFSDKSPRDTLE